MHLHTLILDPQSFYSPPYVALCALARAAPSLKVTHGSLTLRLRLVLFLLWCLMMRRRAMSSLCGLHAMLSTMDCSTLRSIFLADGWLIPCGGTCLCLCHHSSLPPRQS